MVLAAAVAAVKKKRINFINFSLLSLERPTFADSAAV